MLYKLTYPLYRLLKAYPLVIPILLVALIVAPFASLIYAKIYQNWDRDPDRGAIGIAKGEFNESYQTPKYLDQGWTANDSLWFYNTSQGSALMPYDMFLALKEAGDSGKPLNSNETFDKFRYLPQKATFFNPDALPVGFTKTTYKDKDYLGYTCAACHTGQINFKEKSAPANAPAKAIRIDGGPAMADMVGFLTALEKALEALEDTGKNAGKRQAFVKDVRARTNQYASDQEVLQDLAKWTNSVQRYNIINHSNVKYRHGRLDAFGRIYNRVAQYAISKDQLEKLLQLVAVYRKIDGEQKKVRLLTKEQVDKVMENIGNKIVLSDEEFSLVVKRLQSKEPGYPGLSLKNFLYVRNAIFNTPDAPVSYPFLWDISHSDYLQWNGLAANAGPGPLGRNTGEVIGVFGILDWGEVDDSWLHPFGKLAKYLSGQWKKTHVVGFNSSINIFNLQRLESRLRALESPRWPFCRTAEGDYFLPESKGPEIKLPKDDNDDKADREYCQGKGTRFDKEMKRRGELVYIDRCRGCHALIDRSDWNRVVVGHMSDVDRIGTDRAMAENSVERNGKSGNFADTYQETPVGHVIVAEDAPVVQILTSATKGVIATPDADKWLPRRIVEWVYALVMSFADNTIKESIKSGDYNPDTTAAPYASLRAYKGRSLNGIWATAPYLHNGSVPTLWHLLGKVEDRPAEFRVGAREFDPKNVGFVNDKDNKDNGLPFGSVDQRGNSNKGHDYFCKTKPKVAPKQPEESEEPDASTTTGVQPTAAKPEEPDASRTPSTIGVQPAAANLEKSDDCMTEDQVWDLIEYLKSL
jgi:hypothetical protein